MATIVNYQEDLTLSGKIALFYQRLKRFGYIKASLLAGLAIIVLVIPLAFYLAWRQQNLLQHATDVPLENAFEVTTSSGTPLAQPTPGVYTTDSLDVQIRLKDVSVLNQL